ncbi:type VI secretion system contractile sheath domain-containing protein [Rhodoferax sp.]|uniref:type VI secretion system contractile sheath domain-containing protein n=1 Tax=Rhodoferax sp. TaxID=50421 RepID=UPI0027688BB9|nr:type VI secretion system contractile sheath large subunit [Rhodoferax sp.]
MTAAAPAPAPSSDAIADWSPNFGYLASAFKDWSSGRPVRVAVLGHFGASAAQGRVLTGDALAQAARPAAVEFDSVDALLARLAPRLHLPLGPNGGTIDIAFRTLDDFHPDALFDRLEVFSALAGVRQRLLSPATFADAAAQLMQEPTQATAPVGMPRMATQAGTASSGLTLPSDARLSDFARLVGGPALPAPGPASPIDALLRHVVAPHVQPATDPRRDDLVASVDASLADLMRSVLHHPQFQALESLWRGLDFLLRRVETSADLSVHLLDVPVLSFAADLVASDDLTGTGLYQLLVDQPAEQADGGYTLVLACYQFAVTPPHVELLGRIAGIAQRAGAVFVSSIQAQAFAAAPGGPDALHPLTAHAWQTLRGLSAADHLALAAPRFMLRYPYGQRSDPITRFAFEEFSEREGLRALLWGHPAWLLACLLAGPEASRAQADVAAIVDDLPFHFAVDQHGDQVALPCTDLLLDTDATTRLATQGLVPVVGRRGLPQVQLAPLQSVAGQRLLGRPSAPRGSRDEVFSASANRQRGWSAVLEMELSSLLTPRTTQGGVSPLRDPGLDALINGESAAGPPQGRTAPSGGREDR